MYPDSEASYSAGSFLTSPINLFISLSLEPHLLYDYTTSKIVAIQVMIFTQFTCGKYGKSVLLCLYVYFSVLMETPKLKSV